MTIQIHWWILMYGTLMLLASDFTFSATLPPIEKVGMQHRPVGLSPADTLAEQIFIRAIVEKPTVYQGEPFLLTYKLYFAKSISDPDNALPFQPEGFRVKEVPHPRKPFRETIHGKEYGVVYLKKVWLTPQQAGTFTISPIRTKITIQLPPKADDFFGEAQMQSFTAIANPLSIQVLPLPSGNRPAHFTGAVGKFTVQEQLAKDSIAVQTPVRFTIILRGQGNLRVVKAPVLLLPRHVEVFDPASTLQESADERNFTHTYTCTYTLLAVKPGLYRIPALPITYFDPLHKQYQTLTTKEYTLTVTDSTGKIPATLASGANADKDSRHKSQSPWLFVKSAPPVFYTPDSAFFGSKPFFILLLLPFIMLAGLYGYVQKEAAIQANPKELLYRRTQKQLAAYQTTLISFDKAHWQQIASVLYRYLCSQLDVCPEEASLDKLKNIALFSNQSPNLIKDMVQLIENCNVQGFGPDSPAPDFKAIVAKANFLVRQLKKETSIHRNFRAVHLSIALVVFVYGILPQKASVHATSPEKNSFPKVFQVGIQYYQDGNYKAAIDTYMGLLKKKYTCPEVYCNLGNAYFRSGNLPEAILQYERAMQLASTDQEILHNLQLADQQLILQSPVTRTFLAQNGRSIGLTRTSIDILAYLGLFLLWMGMGTLVVFQLLHSPRRLLRKGSIFSCVAGILLVGTASIGYCLFEKQTRSVVISETYARYAPSPYAKEVFHFPPGVRLLELDAYKGWIKVKLPNEQTGWVIMEAVEQIENKP